MPRSTNPFSALETCTVGITRDMLHTPQITDQTETKPAMSQSPPESTQPAYYVRSTDLRRCTKIPLKVHSVDTGHPLAVDSLLDCGATGMFIDVEFVKQYKLQTRLLPRAVPVFNIDGTPNEAGPIKEEVDLICTFGDHTERATLLVTSIGQLAIILGHPWLVEHNPEVNWRTGEVKMTRCPESCGMGHRTIKASTTISQQLAEKANESVQEKAFEDLVPESYHDFKDVFSKESFDQLPSRKPWDHAIELIPDAQPFSTKVYPMSPIEQRELDSFLEENLKSHRIRPSKSPMASPVFFVKKKDGNLRFVQDYRKLNDITIKNAYPLPLIPDIMNKIAAGHAKYFTKLDVRWGYNNVRIKEGDEWKAAFRTNRGLYEPLVMFFGLTNSPATFQTMMNDIFKTLIDEGVVVVYMDDILIFTESLKEHRATVR